MVAVVKLGNAAGRSIVGQETSEEPTPDSLGEPVEMAPATASLQKWVTMRAELETRAQCYR